MENVGFGLEHVSVVAEILSSHGTRPSPPPPPPTTRRLSEATVWGSVHMQAPVLNVTTVSAPFVVVELGEHVPPGGIA